MHKRISIFSALLLSVVIGYGPASAQVSNRTVQPLVPAEGASLQTATSYAEQVMRTSSSTLPELPFPGRDMLQKFNDRVGGGNADFATASALFDSVQALNETMEGFEPDYSPNGMPGIPLSCSYVAEGEDPGESEACNQCYADATGQIDDVRVDFERLRAVGSRTKTFVDAALAFGDSFSNVGNNGAIGWTQSRPEVMASYKSFKNKYAASLKTLLGKLDQGLRALDACENEHFDNPDWYNRHGFIYFAFMEGRYVLE